METNTELITQDIEKLTVALSKIRAYYLAAETREQMGFWGLAHRMYSIKKRELERELEKKLRNAN